MSRDIILEYLVEQGAWTKVTCEKETCCSLRCYYVAGIGDMQLSGVFYTREAAYMALDNELNSRYAALNEERNRDE